MKRASEIQFVKMCGAGNDFILIDNRSEKIQIDWERFALRYCNRRYGIGADGLLVLEKSTLADVLMLYFNADGSSGSMCGNGGRCVARFLLDRLPTDRLSTISIESCDHVYHAKEHNSKIQLQMKDPQIIEPNGSITIQHKSIKYSYIDSGSPHVVIFINDLDKFFVEMIRRDGIADLGKEIRDHERFYPGGTNVNFVETLKERAIRIRTFERGVEAETLACGTGAVACTIALTLRNESGPPIEVLTASNEQLEVSFIRNGNKYANTILTGNAETIYFGTVDLREIRNYDSIGITR